MYRRPENVTVCYALNPERRGAGYRIGGAYLFKVAYLIVELEEVEFLLCTLGTNPQG